MFAMDSMVFHGMEHRHGTSQVPNFGTNFVTSAKFKGYAAQCFAIRTWTQAHTEVELETN